jgi:hypothetical protein
VLTPLVTCPELDPVMFAIVGATPVIVLVTTVPLSIGTVTMPNCRSADPCLVTVVCCDDEPWFEFVEEACCNPEVACCTISTL